ncbi:uncharacterized protein BDR25DRAFT_317666 [Lindgomyces ingoldianus]|uniref:Uncharacterized protein n=1 Tax=Lindgomyces ingoldianus TaxID=673940 RepID=A0ACB6QH84_9PLEO|nr:uncharacterized protein BDR25DRAFT_317666 [Lindgomyces ingoldianus]KAF2466247.1 hypothetical protein BDR25DRAFT_317666 [Lindgomyces ingoldianus]
MSGFGGVGTEFISRLDPPRDMLKGYDNTKTYKDQSGSVPQIFRDAMSVREEVFGEQGVPLEAEFDEDDPRSYHFVVYASVAPTSSSPPPGNLKDKENISKIEEDRRRSSSAQRLPVGTIRLIPPPHGPNKYKEGDKHPDADPPPSVSAHPTEPYIKLGRLSILKEYRSLGLAKLLINAAIDYAAQHPEEVCPPPSPTALEAASRLGKAAEDAVLFRGLCMIHAQVNVEKLWNKYGFTEELITPGGAVIEIPAEDHWVEEGLEHMAMWKRVNMDAETGRL